MEKDRFLEEKGFREDISYIYAGKWLYAEVDYNDIWENVSYYGYLEKKFDVDILEKKTIDKIERPREDCLNYAPGMGYPLVDVLAFRQNGWNNASGSHQRPSGQTPHSLPWDHVQKSAPCRPSSQIWH